MCPASLTIASPPLLLPSPTSIGPAINNMSKQYVGKDYSKAKAQGDVTIDQLDSLAETSYPLCMRELHRTLRQNHKLKHDGRLQHGLFLKVGRGGGSEGEAREG